MKYSIEELIQEADKLPPLPQAAQKALAILRRPESNAAGLARVLGTDQVLTTRVLRWANSAYYGMGNRIVTVQQAVVVLGLNTVQELITTYMVSDYLNRPLPGYDLQRGELWQHSLGTAIGAKLISKQHHLNFDEEAYFAGLLCDIGKLVFEKLLRTTDLRQAPDDPSSFLAMEFATFGIDHAILGAEMARRWQLPDNLVAVIAFHHQPEAAPQHQMLVSAIHVADAAMMMLGVGIGIDGLHYPFDQDALKRLGMNEEDLLRVVSQIADEMEHAKELISNA